MSNGITILGLGPGDPQHLTRQAWDWLNNCGEVYLRTKQHPTVAALPENLEQHSFDALYENSQRFEEVYEEIVKRILELGARPQGVTYAVPGDPYVAESTGPEIVRRARAQGIPVRVMCAPSFLEPTFSALEIDPFPDLVMIDAMQLAARHHPLFPPTLPALIAQVYNRRIAAEVKLTLSEVYPDEYAVVLVHAAGTPAQLVEHLKLYEIDRSEHVGLLTSLYVPPLPADSSFEAFQDLVAHLRAPEGCPWDREQSHASLRTSLLEETYEVLAALDAQDMEALCEELGDLQMQIVMHAQIASEEGEFRMSDVLSGIHRKIVFRHPHVFGEVKVDGTSGVLVNWEKLKAAERKAKGQDGEKGLLDGVPKTYPALSQAQAYQSRAARVNFDWTEIDGVLQKVHEELKEVADAPDAEHRASELGDLLFAVVNLVRWYKVDAESALRETNLRFQRRFSHVEKRVKENGRQLGELSLAELDVYWDEAKRLEKGLGR